MTSDMPFLEHLKELRTRLLWVLIIVTIGAIAAYNYADIIFAILSAPYYQYFPRSSLIGTGPAEAFILKLKIALFAGFILTSPLTFWQLWLFVAPGMHEKERRLALPFIVIASALFLSGAYICYSEILPFTFAFFKDQYDSIAITPQIRVSEQLSLLIFAILGFGAMFELPVITYLLARTGIVTHRLLIAWWRYAVVLIFVLSAILTPTPDVLTMVLFAAPLLVLYVVSIGAAWFVTRRNAATTNALAVKPDTQLGERM